MQLRYLFNAEGDDYTTNPSALIFPHGQTAGDIQCVNITIIDDPFPQEERSLTISLGNSTVGDGRNSEGGRQGEANRVRFNPNSPSIYISIALDSSDGKLSVLF